MVVNNVVDIIDEYISQLTSEPGYVRHYICLSVIIVAAIIVGVVFKRLIAPLIVKVTSRTSTKFDDYLLNDPILRILSQLIPVFIIYSLLPLCFIGKETESAFYIVCSRALSVYAIVLVARFVVQVLRNIHDYSNYGADEADSEKHYVGVLVQFATVVIYFFVIIISIATIIGKNPSTLLASLGAMAAVLMLVFQDSILGLVAGMQLSINDMLKVGDWIQLSDKGINGIVTKVNLTTIKVQNFDNSIATIPPHALVSNTFRNWKGIDESGTREARRRLYVDVNSIKFLAMHDVETMAEHLHCHVADLCGDGEPIVNATLYRKYIEHYLSGHENVDATRWLMVRQIENTSLGMPIELYFYVKETDFVKYEGIVADIIDYVVAIAPVFGIKIYQSMGSKVVTTLADD